MVVYDSTQRMLRSEDFYDILSTNERLLDETRHAQRRATETSQNVKQQERYLQQAVKLGIIPKRFLSPARASSRSSTTKSRPASTSSSASAFNSKRPGPPPKHSIRRPSQNRQARELAIASASTSNSAAAALAATEALYQGPMRRSPTSSGSTASGSSDSESSRDSLATSQSSSSSSQKAASGSLELKHGSRCTSGAVASLQVAASGGERCRARSCSPYRDLSSHRRVEQLACGSEVEAGGRVRGTWGGEGSRIGRLLREPTPLFLRRWRANRKRKNAKKQVVRFLLRTSDDSAGQEGGSHGTAAGASGGVGSADGQQWAGGSGGTDRTVVIAYPGSTELFPPAAVPYSLAEALQAARPHVGPVPPQMGPVPPQSQHGTPPLPPQPPLLLQQQQKQRQQVVLQLQQQQVQQMQQVQPTRHCLHHHHPQQQHAKQQQLQGQWEQELGGGMGNASTASMSQPTTPPQQHPARVFGPQPLSNQTSQLHNPSISRFIPGTIVSHQQQQQQHNPYRQPHIQRFHPQQYYRPQPQPPLQPHEISPLQPHRPPHLQLDVTGSLGVTYGPPLHLSHVHTSISSPTSMAGTPHSSPTTTASAWVPGMESCGAAAGPHPGIPAAPRGPLSSPLYGPHWQPPEPVAPLRTPPSGPLHVSGPRCRTFSHQGQYDNQHAHEYGYGYGVGANVDGVGGGDFPSPNTPRGYPAPGSSLGGSFPPPSVCWCPGGVRGRVFSTGGVSTHGGAVRTGAPAPVPSPPGCAPPASPGLNGGGKCSEESCGPNSISLGGGPLAGSGARRDRGFAGDTAVDAGWGGGANEAALLYHGLMRMRVSDSGSGPDLGVSEESEEDMAAAGTVKGSGGAYMRSLRCQQAAIIRDVHGLMQRLEDMRGRSGAKE